MRVKQNTWQPISLPPSSQPPFNLLKTPWTPDTGKIHMSIPTLAKSCLPEIWFQVHLVWGNCQLQGFDCLGITESEKSRSLDPTMLALWQHWGILCASRPQAFWCHLERIWELQEFRSARDSGHVKQLMQHSHNCIQRTPICGGAKWSWASWDLHHLGLGSCWFMGQNSQISIISYCRFNKSLFQLHKNPVKWDTISSSWLETQGS